MKFKTICLLGFIVIIGNYLHAAQHAAVETKVAAAQSVVKKTVPLNYGQFCTEVIACSADQFAYLDKTNSIHIVDLATGQENSFFSGLSQLPFASDAIIAISKKYIIFRSNDSHIYIATNPTTQGGTLQLIAELLLEQPLTVQKIVISPDESCCVTLQHDSFKSPHEAILKLFSLKNLRAPQQNDSYMRKEELTKNLQKRSVRYTTALEALNTFGDSLVANACNLNFVNNTMLVATFRNSIASYSIGSESLDRFKVFTASRPIISMANISTTDETCAVILIDDAGKTFAWKPLKSNHKNDNIQLTPQEQALYDYLEKEMRFAQQPLLFSPADSNSRKDRNYVIQLRTKTRPQFSKEIEITDLSTVPTPVPAKKEVVPAAQPASATAAQEDAQQPVLQKSIITRAIEFVKQHQPAIGIVAMLVIGVMYDYWWNSKIRAQGLNPSRYLARNY